MHFGKRLERDLVERWRPHYLQYKLLKKHIKDLEENLKTGAALHAESMADDTANGLLANQQLSYHEFSFPGPKAHRFNLLNSFKPILDKEVEKINLFTTSKVAEIQNRILQILRTSTPWKSSSNGAEENVVISDLPAAELFLEQLRTEANTIAQELVDIDKFIRQNCIAIQKIIKKFDKRLDFDVAPWLNAQLMENEPFLKVNLYALMLAVSDAFEKLASLNHEFKLAQGLVKQDDTKKGISAQTFERKTTKYWVRSENIMAIKVAILKNLPIYLFDRKQDATRENFRTKNYLRDFGDLYGGISDSSPITSIYLDNSDMDVYRTRLTREEGWYGDARSLPDKEYIFVERKTHHESWVEAKSVKERFPIKTKNVQAFLDGKFAPAESMKKWMKPDSKGLKLVKNDKELEKAIVLSTASFETIQKRALRPMVRTLYRRTAFQARDHNEVRISIDTQLMMVNEDVTPAPGNEFPWCRDMVHSNIPPSDILQFPYCILEVKINCDHPPAWIANILADTNTVVECHKFSKFLTGVAYHQYQKVPELPHWFKDNVSIDPRNRFMSSEEREKLIYQDAALKFEGKDGESGSDDEPAIKPVKKEKKPTSATSTKASAAAASSSHTAVDMPEDGADEKTPLIARDLSSNFSQHASTAHLPNTSGIFSNIRNRLLGRHSRAGSHNADKEKKPLKPTRSTDRIKIEPKTSFANERTLIQWVSAASLMITLATLIMTSGSELGFKAGFVFFPLAFVIMLYAIIRYQYRAWSFRHRRNQFHDDLYGPVFLVIAIASAMGVIMFLMFYYNAPVPVQFPTDSPADGCYKYTNNGADDYFPYSDVALVGNDVIAVGPFAMFTFNHDTNAWVRTEFPDQHISAVVGSPSKSTEMYVGIEKPSLEIRKFSKVSMKLDDSPINLAELKKHYNITVKALAVTGETASSTDFLIGDEDGSLYVVSATWSSGSSKSSAHIKSVIPGARLAKGLVDEEYYKRISGMFYDSHLTRLYVLFGRSRRLRVFDIKNYTMLNEWHLPGTSFQWSGVAVQTEAEGDEQYVYLSQSVPGAVWKFKLKPEAVKLKAAIGDAFHGCANTYDGDMADMMKIDPGDKLRRNRLNYVSDY